VGYRRRQFFSTLCEMFLGSTLSCGLFLFQCGQYLGNGVEKKLVFMSLIKRCQDCGYSTHGKYLKGNYYSVCAHPTNPQGAIASVLNCEMFKKQ